MHGANDLIALCTILANAIVSFFLVVMPVFNSTQVQSVALPLLRPIGDYLQYSFTYMGTLTNTVMDVCPLKSRIVDAMAGLRR